MLNLRIDFNEDTHMPSPIPFHHNDVSALAKSLRGALSSANIGSLKHTDVLNILAKSKGFSNFQAYKASESSASIQHMIVLKAVPSSFSQLSEQVQQDKTFDHQSQRVQSLLFRLNVSIELGHRSADVVIHALARGHNWSFEPDYVPSKERVWQESMSELTKQLQNNELRPFFRNYVNIGLPKIATADESYHGGFMQDVVLNAAQFATVGRVVDQIKQATTECQSVVDWLRDIARSPDDTQQHKAAVSLAFDYIDAVAGVSGDSYLNSWSVVKMASIRYYLTQWSSGNGSNSHAKEFQELFPFKAPTAWIGTPPELGALLRKHIKINLNRSS
jgi:hypothetical protein